MNYGVFKDEGEFSFPPLAPQSTIFGLGDLTDNFTLLNHLLLIFKFYIYSAREKTHVSILQLKSAIKKINDVELEVSRNEHIKRKKY